MMSLVTRQSRTPVEDLQSPRGRTYHLAHRTRRKRLQTWRIGTWNVRSMVDTEGCVEIASRRHDGQRGEDRKVYLVVGDLKR